MQAPAPLELLGTALGLLNLWLTLRQNIWCWPVGIACVLCYISIFYDARLYSDLSLQVAYVALQSYGWCHWWQQGRAGTGLATVSTAPITRLTAQQRMQWCCATLAAALGLGTLMATYTQADLPYVDALPTAMSLTAQWLQARKVLDSWLIFIAANLIFIGIYAVKGLYVTIILYAVSSVFAVFGWRAWRARAL